MLRLRGRIAICIGLVLVFITFFITRNSSYRWQDLPLEAIGLGEGRDTLDEKDKPAIELLEEAEKGGDNNIVLDGKKKFGHSNIIFSPGVAKPAGANYTKALVVPRTSSEDVAWIDENFSKDSNVTPYIYVVDDVTAPLHPPKNKGHEVMVYLSYIIDNYDDNLSDVNIFMHSHQKAWHNNDMLDSDAVQMINRLSAERVQREGYMNLRCEWGPGCPDWMHPGNSEQDPNKQEEVLIARSWSELFPMDPIPIVLAQPCCAQFAVSGDRIRTLPKARYVFYRDWLLRTRLSDYISGRVWEYLWHFIFTGQHQMCPESHVCYCDGYGICFGSKEKYEKYHERRHDKEHYEGELRDWKEKSEKLQRAKEDSRIDEAKEMDIPEFGKDVTLAKQIDELAGWLEIEKKQAFERGEVAKNRAMEVGRPWQEGDGF